MLFHGYGFGLFEVSIATGLLVGGRRVVGQLLLSPLSLKWFYAGPLEWLWRSLAERRARPLLR